MRECEPMASAGRVKEAWPLARFAEPRLVSPSLKVTVPVGVPVPGAEALIVAVTTTDWPKTDGSTDELTEVVVLAWFTVCVLAPDVLPVKLLSPA